MERCSWLSLLGTFLSQLSLATCQEFCSDSSFWCSRNTGGGGRCCSYYYELWWFWAIWAVVIILSCCCLYQQRRTQHRHRSPRHYVRRSPPSTFPILLFDSDRFRLPTYDEIKELPQDPPPYDHLSEMCLPESSIGCSDLPSLTATPSECVDVSMITHEESLVRDPPPPYSSKSSLYEPQNPV